MRRKPRLLLLDAGAVIGAFACGGWAALCAAYEIVIPSIVVAESMFFTDGDGRKHGIDLEPFLSDGRAVRYEADVAEFARTSAILSPELRQRIHAGEREALTYLRTEETEGVAFITGDGAAIEATVALGVAECAISLEDALRRCGSQKPLPAMLCDAFVREHIRRGGVLLAQGRALAT